MVSIENSMDQKQTVCESSIPGSLDFSLHENNTHEVPPELEAQESAPILGTVSSRSTDYTSIGKATIAKVRQQDGIPVPSIVREEGVLCRELGIAI